MNDVKNNALPYFFFNPPLWWLWILTMHVPHKNNNILISLLLHMALSKYCINIHMMFKCYLARPYRENMIFHFIFLTLLQHSNVISQTGMNMWWSSNLGPIVWWVDLSINCIYLLSSVYTEKTAGWSTCKTICLADAFKVMLLFFYI